MSEEDMLLGSLQKQHSEGTQKINNKGGKLHAAEETVVESKKAAWKENAEDTLAHHCDSVISKGSPERLKGFLAPMHFFCTTCLHILALLIATPLPWTQPLLWRPQLPVKASLPYLLIREAFSKMCLFAWEPAGRLHDRHWNILWAENKANRECIELLCLL